MSDYYFDNKKAQFKDTFEKQWDENLSDFLHYVSIEINREFMGNLNELKDSIKELTESNYKE